MICCTPAPHLKVKLHESRREHYTDLPETNFYECPLAVWRCEGIVVIRKHRLLGGAQIGVEAMMKELNISDRLSTYDPQPAPAFVPQARQAGPRAQAIGDVLTRHVPNMARGFVIFTGHSEWQVSGEMAKRMTRLMREALMDELVKADDSEFS